MPAEGDPRTRRCGSAPHFKTQDHARRGDYNNRRGELNNMKNASKKLGVALVTGMLSLGVASLSHAAENASGVVEFMGKTVETTKEAYTHAKEGNEKACVDSIKQVKQFYKEITGDAAGKPLQDAMKKVKAAQLECEKGEGGGVAASAILGEAVVAMEKIKAGMK
jgi:hypothetical protein